MSKVSSEKLKTIRKVSVSKEDRQEFKKLFGIPLKDYWEKNLGFDIIKFDKEVVKSGSKCMHDAIQDRWGDAAAILVRRLVRIGSSSTD